MARGGVAIFPGGRRVHAVELDDAFGLYATRLRSQGLAVNSVKAYLSDLADLQAFALSKGITLVGLLSDRLLAHWCDNMTQRGIAGRSQSRRLSAVRNFLSMARIEGWIPRDFDPTAEIRIRFRARRVTAPEMGELLGIVDNIKTVGGASWGEFEAIRDRAMLRLALDAGLRIGACASLDVPSAEHRPELTVDLTRLLVHAYAKGKGVYTVPFDETTARYLQAWLGVRDTHAKPGSAALFVSRRGGRFTRQALDQLLKRRAAKAGIKAIHWQLLRHRRIGDVYDRLGGRTAQGLAGHAHLSTTENTYGAHAVNVTHQILRTHAALPEPGRAA